MEYIRSYNSALAFASMGSNIDHKVAGGGPYCFRIHGQIYRRTSTSVVPPEGQTPKYAQLYILDAELPIGQRMSI